VPDFFWRWCVAWLDRKNLGSVASVLEARAARGGSIDALHAVAKRALAAGDHAAALLAIRTALEKSPQDAALWCTCGAAHRHAMEFDAARAAYEQAIRLNPRSLQALSNLGEWQLARGSADLALEQLDAALAIDPDFFEARVNRVAALFELGRFEAARLEAEKLVESAPDRPEPYVNLGNVLVHTGQAKQAVKQYRKALELRPDYVEAHFNLATLLGSQEDLKKAIGYLEQQIEAKGESIHRLGLLAAAHQAAGHLGKAEELCRTMIARQPESLSAHITLASCISNAGDAAAALPVYERVVELDESQPAMASNVLFELNYLAEYSREEIFQRHLAWARKFERVPESPPAFEHRNRCTQRKLKIGYVSGDFCAHPVGFLLRDILANHDREAFEIHCFSMLLRPDDVSAALQASADHWEDIFLLNDDELAELVAKAEIDVLIDLSGHTAFHRLVAFSRRLAPVQATWIGYFHSTGMSAMDYFITDPHTSPQDSGQRFSEVPVHLPDTRFCFSVPDYAPDVVPPPCGDAGPITFGSFNRLAKLNAQVIHAWSQILLAVPDSRLVLKAGALSEETVRDALRARFAEQGVVGARLDLRPASAHREMFAEYGDIDIALDAFPFNGGMTTIEALWMGVPVLTLEGDSVVSRQTYSVLANLDLCTDLACSTVSAYVARAVALANDRQTLARLRSGLRQRMQASPICQAAEFTHDFEALLRTMWTAWCNDTKLGSNVASAPVKSAFVAIKNIAVDPRSKSD
jgi:predicted O-linked N-acetylglucosamine transferase (SPINDLY family)